MNFYKHHIGDYAQATSHLSFVEDAAYSRLLRKYYAEEKPIPGDMKAACRLVAARTKDEKEAVETVLNEFFILDTEASVWRNKRADEEITKANAQAETNRRIAEEREARKRARIANESSTNRSGSEHESCNETNTKRQPSQTPDSRLQTKTEEQGGKPPLSPASADDDSADDESDGKRVPQCPHTEILTLYAEKLPELPQPIRSLWADSKGAEALRARWRWVMTSRHEAGIRKGQRLADSPDEGIAWFGRFFDYVRTCPLLMGEKGEWHADLSWLVTARNFAKVLQGNYEAEAA